MGHNVSEEKARRAALAAPLADWGDWLLHIDCGSPSCARGRHYAVSHLLPHYPGVSLAQAVAALKCTICRGPAVKVRLTRRKRGRDEEVHWVRR